MIQTPCVRLLLVAAIASATGACGGDDDNADSRPLPSATVQQLDAAIEDALKTQHLPGAAVGIWIPGTGRYVKAFGSADLDSGLPRSADDRFRIASLTKTFIGTAILQLADAGKLKKTDTIAKWYPDFPQGERVTVEDLLRMRSGLADSADKSFLAEYYQNPLTTLSADDMIQRAAARSGEFKTPDTETVYNNLNFILLERIVEKVSGEDIQHYLRKHVFDPLGMAHTVYPRGTAFPKPLRGYSAEPSETGALVDRTVLNPLPAGGAGAMISTLDDLHAYVSQLCGGGLLKESSQKARLETTPFKGLPDTVGYGEALAKLGPYCGHNGTIFGFSSEMWYLPKDGTVIVINVNRLDLDDHSQSSALFGTVSQVIGVR